MRAAAVFPADRKFAVIDHPEPCATSPTEVTMRMLDVGVCGTDREIAAFEYGTPPDGANYLVIGHESLCEVIETGPEVSRVKKGDLAVATVRRPCEDPSCIACRQGRQDFCYTGKYTERGIMRRHGYMTEVVVEEERYLTPVPHALRDVAVLVEPLTVAEKAVVQLCQVQSRLPWLLPAEDGTPPARGRNALVLGAGPVGLLGAMKLVLEGFNTTVYSRTPPNIDIAGLVAGFGAKLVHTETVPVAKMAREIGSIDVVYEATGSAPLAFEVLPYLGIDGAFIFTGVPGLKPPIPMETEQIMRDLVLKNQAVFGTVNASIADFGSAIQDLGTFAERWPKSVRSLITRRFPIDDAAEPLNNHVGGIKNVIAINQ